MKRLTETAARIARRQFFGRSACGVGAIALSSLLAGESNAAEQSVRSRGGLPDLPHWLPKAKRVIYLLQNGAPSHVDLFDHKPMLRRWHGTQIPDSVVGGKRFSTMTGSQTERPVLSEITQFARHGASGGSAMRARPACALPSRRFREATRWRVAGNGGAATRG